MTFFTCPTSQIMRAFPLSSPPIGALVNGLPHSALVNEGPQSFCSSCSSQKFSYFQENDPATPLQ